LLKELLLKSIPYYIEPYFALLILCWASL